jgi:casein kinase II subunit beta
MTVWVSSLLLTPEGSFFVALDPEFITSESQLPEIRHRFMPGMLAGAVATILGTEKSPKFEPHARRLYGLLHRRFLLTPEGRQLMIERHRAHAFPPCPRALCHGFTCLPCALADDDDEKTPLSLFCPNCADFYTNHAPIDTFIPAGYFGKKWIHKVMNEHPEIVPPSKPEPFEPLLFGFKMYIPKPKA